MSLHISEAEYQLYSLEIFNCNLPPFSNSLIHFRVISPVHLQIFLHAGCEANKHSYKPASAFEFISKNIRPPLLKHVNLYIFRIMFRVHIKAVALFEDGR